MVFDSHKCLISHLRVVFCAPPASSNTLLIITNYQVSNITCYLSKNINCVQYSDIKLITVISKESLQCFVGC